MSGLRDGAVGVPTEVSPALLEAVAGDVTATGFSALQSTALESLVTPQELSDLAAAWSNLPVDPALPSGATYRERRFARTRITVQGQAVTFDQLPAGTFRQDSIPLWAGQERVFPHIEDQHMVSPALRKLMAFDAAIATRLTSITSWDVGVHFIRVIALPSEEGLTTPEGRHRDGHMFVGMHLLGRTSVEAGESTVWAEDGSETSLTMVNPLDSMFVDDRRVTHGVSPCTAVGERGHRDMLLVDLNPTE